MADSSSTVSPTVARSRRQLIVDGIGISVSAIGFAVILGLSYRAIGISPIEAAAMSVIVFAGASQFAAVGYIAAGLPWLGIVALSGFLNARHFLYAASLAPYLAEQPRWLRAVAAHVLTDEAYALTIAHFRRIGRTDMFGYWWAAIAVVFIPWNIATLVGVVIGGSIPDPAQFGLDIFFPAAMAGLAVGLIAGRRELVAALAGAAIGVSVGLLFDPAAGVVAGGLIGPLFGLIVPPSPEREISALAFERTPER